MQRAQIVIVGAGAAGLMAGRELAKAGIDVTILEARNRTGGRIYPLDERDFGYPAQGGAEFVHGAAPFTHSVAYEAGLTLTPRQGEVWNAYSGKLSQDGGQVPGMALVREKLKELKNDMTIAEFLDTYFGEVTHTALRNAIERMVEGYDAADPLLASTFALRDEWMGDGFGKQMRIREGYGALTTFLETECKIYGADIRLNSEVETIDVRSDRAKLICGNGDRYEVARVLVTIPLPLLFQVVFLPALPKKMEAARNIGFGEVIKIVLKFRTRWWLRSQEKDLGNMFILRSNEVVPVWWTQYPEHYPVLTGWLSGPGVKNYMNMSSSQMLSIGLLSLANNFDVDVDELIRELVTSKIINWTADRYSRGAYTYATLGTPAAKEELLKPIKGVLFFSGEALYEGKEVGTVEAALASGAKAAERILRSGDALGERGGE